MKNNINLNEESSKSQGRKILEHMLRGNKITGIDALELYGSFRLPARIADIKKKGYDVQSGFVTTASGKRVKAYWIEDKYAPKY